MLRFRRITNIVDGTETFWEREWISDRRLETFLPQDFSREGSGMIEVNGQLLTGEEATHYYPKDGDRIVLADVPGVILTAVAVGLGFSSVAAFVLTTVAVVGLSVGLTYGVYLLYQNKTPRLPEFDPANPDREDDAGGPRSFRGAQNTIGAGATIPIIYGQTRYFGHILESFTGVRFEKSSDESETTVNDIPEVNRALSAAPTLNTRVGFCWGPIDSLTLPEIDENPIANVKGTKWELVLGTPHQKPLEGFSETKTPKAIGTAVTVAGGPVDSQTTIAVDTVELKITFTGGLGEIGATTAELLTKNVDVRFKYKLSTAGSYTTFDTVTFSGATRNPVPFWVRFPKLDRAIYDVRVERITADDADPLVLDDFEWTTMQQVVQGERAFPGVAQLGFRQLPQDIVGLPRRYSALVKGFNDIRTYTDPSTYTVGWSENPAWCLAHWITHPIHGLGKFYSYDNINLVEWLEWAAYCDEEVDDGRSGWHKRSAISLAIDRATKVTDIVKLFTEGSDAWVYEDGGTWRVVVDGPRALKTVFGEGDYNLDSLAYSYIETEQRPNQVVIDYLNEERDYKRDSLPQEDQDRVDGETAIPAPYTMWGVSRPAQISRQALKILNRSRLEDAAVEFAVGIKALDFQVGETFGLASPTSSIGVASGVILRVNDDRTKFEIDEDVTLDPQKTYELLLVQQLDGWMASKFVTNVLAVTTNWVEVSNGKWDRQPQPGDSYALGEVGFTTETFRCVSTTLDERFQRKITAVKHSDAIHDFTIPSLPASTGGDVTGTQVFQERLLAPDVTSVTVTDRDIVNAPTGDDYLHAYWEPPDTSAGQTIVGYDVYSRKQNDTRWRFIGFTRGVDHLIGTAYGIDIESGATYEVAVVAVTQGAIRRSIDEATVTTYTEGT